MNNDSETKWVDLGDGEYKCPVCKTEFIYGLSIKKLIKYFPTCPKCGADMRGDDNETRL